jgi:hypothetical protein
LASLGSPTLAAWLFGPVLLDGAWRRFALWGRGWRSRWAILLLPVLLLRRDFAIGSILLRRLLRRCRPILLLWRRSWSSRWAILLLRVLLLRSYFAIGSILLRRLLGRRRPILLLWRRSFNSRGPVLLLRSYFAIGTILLRRRCGLSSRLSGALRKRTPRS